jgi:hypothetical protein
MIEVRGRSKIIIKDISGLHRLAPMGPEHLLPKSREYWLARAKRAYALAEQMRDPLTRSSGLTVPASALRLAFRQPVGACPLDFNQGLYHPA